MNRYRVTVTVFSAESFDREIEAVNEDAARQHAEQSAERHYPDANEIRVDEVELLTAGPEPTPDPLALARDIIAGLLDAADHAAQDWTNRADDAEDDDDTETLVECRMKLEQADTAIAVARAFLATKEPTT